MSGYIRTDISCWNKSEFYLIPTIIFSKWTRGIEISICIFIFCIYTTISYINKDNYEP